MTTSTEDIITDLDALADDWGTDPEAIAAYIESCRVDFGSNLDKYEFLDAYQGRWGSFGEFAEYFFFEVVYPNLPDGIESYIDIDQFAYDLRCEGYWYYDGFVFSPF